MSYLPELDVGSVDLFPPKEKGIVLTAEGPSTGGVVKQQPAGYSSILFC